MNNLTMPLEVFEEGDAAFILLKPDALARELTGMIVELVRQEGLQVTSATDVWLEYSDLAALWPQFDCKLHPLSVHFFELYLTGRRSLLLIVRGSGALIKSQRVKQFIRRKYGHRLLASILHVADSPAECASQLLHLLRYPPVARLSDLSVPLLRSSDFSQLGYNVVELVDICTRLWDEHVSGVLTPIDVPPICHERATHVVVVRDDPDNTCESFTFGFLAAFGALEAEMALRLVLTIDATGETPLVACRADQWPRIRTRLMHLGIPGAVVAPGDGS